MLLKLFGSNCLTNGTLRYLTLILQVWFVTHLHQHVLGKLTVNTPETEFLESAFLTSSLVHFYMLQCKNHSLKFTFLSNISDYNFFCQPSFFWKICLHLQASLPLIAKENHPALFLPFRLYSNRSHQKITRRFQAGSLGSPRYHCLWEQPGSIDLSPGDVNYQPSVQIVSFFSALSLIPEVSAWSREAFNGKLISQTLPVRKLLPGPGSRLEHQGIYVIWGSNYLWNASQRAWKR